MNWEAFATPPADVGAALRKYSRALYTARKPSHEVAILYCLTAADDTYFATLGVPENPLDRRVHA